MKTTIFGIVILAGLQIGSLSAADAPTAEAFLHSIYDGYIGPHQKAPVIDYAKQRELERYFEPSLAKIIADDSAHAAKNGDEGTLEGDPFIDAQDWDIKSFDMKVTPVDADHANALVKFDNLRTAELIHLQLIRISGAWKIHDINYGGPKGTLRGLFKQ